MEAASFDHLVGAGEQVRWHREAERFRCLEIDYQFKFRTLLDREVSWFGTLENFSDIDPYLSSQIPGAASIAD